MLAAEVIPSDKCINILEIYASHSTAAYYRPIRANARVALFNTPNFGHSVESHRDS